MSMLTESDRWSPRDNASCVIMKWPGLTIGTLPAISTDVETKAAGNTFLDVIADGISA